MIATSFIILFILFLSTLNSKVRTRVAQVFCTLNLPDMPQSYIFRMVAMDFRRVFSEAPIAIDSEIKDSLTPEEYQRLSRVKSSLHKYSRFTDTLPQDEMAEKIQEEERRTQVRIPHLRISPQEIPLLFRFSNKILTSIMIHLDVP